MNDTELREFLAGRRPSPQLERFHADQLHCYGCAHSASSAEPPGAPSGERPCSSCIRNPGRDTTRERVKVEDALQIGDDGHARLFDPGAGTMYNGAPRLYWPMDNYVTLDQYDQERWLDEHPEYELPIRSQDGELRVVREEAG